MRDRDQKHLSVASMLSFAIKTGFHESQTKEPKRKTRHIPLQLPAINESYVFFSFYRQGTSRGAWAVAAPSLHPGLASHMHRCTCTHSLAICSFDVC